jgi:predicted nucleic acid-binding protein
MLPFILAGAAVAAAGYGIKKMMEEDEVKTSHKSSDTTSSAQEVDESVKEAVVQEVLSIPMSQEAKNKIEKNFRKIMIYVDSNIFMDFNFDNIFEYFNKNNSKIIILKSQYDEMINIRKKLKAESNSYSEKALKAKRAQITMALNRVEKLIDNTQSQIKDIGLESDKNSYADPVFIKTILKKLKKGKSVIFITQDRDLRTRLKSMIKEDKNIDVQNINIFKADEFIDYVNIMENLIHAPDEEQNKHI